MTKPTIHWRTEWSNGTPTHIITFSDLTDEQRIDIERVADEEGFHRLGKRWSPREGAKLHSLFEAIRAKGFSLDFDKSDENAPFDLQRLRLEPTTRRRLESLQDFTLNELAGYCPVQSDGLLEGQYFYFRARGSYWRFECGGNESHTKGPRWWHEEEWPSQTGFEAGYMSDEDAICCILKSVEIYRTADRSRFERGHPDYARTTLEGWSLGALSLRRAVRRLGISGAEAIEQARGYGIELPHFADRELNALNIEPAKVLGLNKETGEWREMKDEDE